MYKLNSVLRSLVLLFLSGWVGIATQPAEAQQTVSPCPGAGYQSATPKVGRSVLVLRTSLVTTAWGDLEQSTIPYRPSTSGACALRSGPTVSRSC